MQSAAHALYEDLSRTAAGARHLGESAQRGFTVAADSLSRARSSLDLDAVLFQLDQLRIGFSQLGRGSLGGLPNVLKAFQRAGQEAAAVVRQSGFTEAIRQLELNLTGLDEKFAARPLFKQFQQSLLEAATKSDAFAAELKAAFKDLGVEIEQALLRPEKAFADLVKRIGTVQPALVRARSSLGSVIEGSGPLAANFQQNAILATTQDTQRARQLRADFAALGIDVKQAAQGGEAAWARFRAVLQEAEKSTLRLRGLNVILGTESDQLSGAFGRAGQALNRLDNEASAAARAMSGVSGGMSVATVAATVLGVAVLAAVAAFVSLGAEGVRLGAELFQVSQRTGLTVEALSRLQAAGADLNKISAAFDTFKQKAREAALENERLRAVFTALGLDAREAARHPAEAFAQLEQSLTKITDAQTRLRAAQALLGASGAELLTTFIALRENNGALNSELERLGVITSTGTARQLNEVHKQARLVGAQFDALKIQIAAELGPTFIEVLQKMKEALVELKPTIVEIANLLGLAAKAFALINSGPNIPNRLADRFFDDRNAPQPAGPPVSRPFDFGVPTAVQSGARRPDIDRRLIGPLNFPAPSPAASALAFRNATRGQTAPVQRPEVQAAADFFRAQGRQQQQPAAASDNRQLNRALDALNTRQRASRNADAEARAAARARLELTRAELTAETSLIREQLRARELDLKASYDATLITTEQYYAQKLELEQTSLAQEIRENRAAIAAIDAEIAAATARHARQSELLQLRAQKARLEGEGAVLRERQLALPAANDAARRAAQEQERRTVEQIRIAYLELTGAEQQAFDRRLAEEYAEAVKTAAQAGRRDILSLIEKLQTLRSAHFALAQQIKQSQLRFDVRQSQLNVIEETIRGAQTRGLLDDTEATDAAIIARRRFREELLAEAAVQQQLLQQKVRLGGSEAESAQRDLLQINERIAALRNLGAELTSQERIQQQLSDNQVFRQDRANRLFLQHLAEQKSLTQAVADAQIKAYETFVGALEKGIDKLTSKLGLFGEVVADLLKTITRNLITRVLAPAAGSGGFEGPGQPAAGGALGLLGSLLFGGQAGAPAQAAQVGPLGVLLGALGLGNAAGARTPPFVPQQSAVNPALLLPLLLPQAAGAGGAQAGGSTLSAIAGLLEFAQARQAAGVQAPLGQAFSEGGQILAGLTGTGAQAFKKLSGIIPGADTAAGGLQTLTDLFLNQSRLSQAARTPPFVAQAGTAAAGAAAKGSLLQGLAPLAPLLGLSLGSQLGGQSGLGRVLGGAGGLLLGGSVLAAAAPGAITGLLGAIGFGGTNSAILGSAIAGFLTNPITILAGIGLLIGSFFLGRAKQRRQDERNADAIWKAEADRLAELTRLVNADRIDGAQALAEAAQLRQQTIAALNQIKTKSVRESRLKNQLADVDRVYVVPLKEAVERQQKRKGINDLLLPTFAGGGFTGRVPGVFDGADDKLIRVTGNEVVLNPHQQATLADLLLTAARQRALPAVRERQAQRASQPAASRQQDAAAAPADARTVERALRRVLEEPASPAARRVMPLALSTSARRFAEGGFTGAAGSGPAQAAPASAPAPARPAALAGLLLTAVRNHLLPAGQAATGGASGATAQAGQPASSARAQRSERSATQPAAPEVEHPTPQRAFAAAATRDRAPLRSVVNPNAVAPAAPAQTAAREHLNAAAASPAVRVRQQRFAPLTEPEPGVEAFSRQNAVIRAQQPTAPAAVTVASAGSLRAAAPASAISRIAAPQQPPAIAQRAALPRLAERSLSPPPLLTAASFNAPARPAAASLRRSAPAAPPVLAAAQQERQESERAATARLQPLAGIERERRAAAAPPAAGALQPGRAQAAEDRSFLSASRDELRTTVQFQQVARLTGAFARTEAQIASPPRRPSEPPAAFVRSLLQQAPTSRLAQSAGRAGEAAALARLTPDAQRERALPRRAGGGLAVPGVFTGADDLLIRVSGNELILNAHQQATLSAMLLEAAQRRALPSTPAPATALIPEQPRASASASVSAATPTVQPITVVVSNSFELGLSDQTKIVTNAFNTADGRRAAVRVIRRDVRRQGASGLAGDIESALSG